MRGLGVANQTPSIGTAQCACAAPCRAARPAIPSVVVLCTLQRSPLAVSAQGGNVDIISGTVTDPAGKPVPNAQIEALSIETDVTRRTQTDAKGHYILFFNDGGGQYRVTARAIGHSPSSRT